MKRSVTLLELLAMILVFALCAAVCLRILGASWRMSQESGRLTEAVYLAESAAARLQSGALLGQGTLPKGEFLLAEGDSLRQQGYDLHIEEIERGNGLRVERVTVLYEGEVIYELDVTCGEGVS